MAHPHAQKPEDHRDRAHRVIAGSGHEMPHGKMRNGYKAGGAIHEDAEEDAAMIRDGVGQHEDNDHPGKPKTKLKFKVGGSVEGHEARHHLGRRARGGPTNKKGTHVNVIVAPQGGGGGMRPAMPAMQPPAPMPAPPPRPPMAAPPPPGMGMQPGGGMAPKPPGMMNRGGRTGEGAHDAADYEQKRSVRAKGGKVQNTSDVGTPWQNILHSKRGGGAMKRDVGGPTGMPSATAGMPGAGQVTPQQQQAAQQMMAQRAAQARMTPAAGMPGVPTQKRGGATERRHGGGVDMEAGAGGGEGRIEKANEYGSGRGFTPKEHNGEMLRRRVA